MANTGPFSSPAAVDGTRQCRRVLWLAFQTPSWAVPERGVDVHPPVSVVASFALPTGWAAWPELWVPVGEGVGG